MIRALRIHDAVFLIGSGILLILIGVFSIVPLTRVFAIGLGAFIFYTAYRSMVPLFAGERETDEEGYHEEIEEEQEDEYFEPIAAPKRDPVPVQQKPSAPPPAKETPRVTEQRSEQSVHSSESRSDFNDVLHRMLRILKESTFAHTVAFFWVNAATRQLVVEGKVSESATFTGERKIPLGADMVGQIADLGEAKIVNQITSTTERDVLCYYTSLQDVRSFIGVPVYYGADAQEKQTIGVLVLDSKAEDAFGQETLGQLTEYAELIARVLQHFTEKFDLAGDRKTLQALSELQHQFSREISTAGIVNGFMDALEAQIAWDAMALVMFDEGQQQWVLASVRVRGNFKFVAAKQVISLDGTIIGAAIKNSSSLVIGDLAKNDDPVFYDGEQKELLSQGSLLAVPFVTQGQCYGGVIAVSRKNDSYTRRELSVAGNLASLVAAAMETRELKAIIEEHVTVEEQTGIMKRKFFLSRFDEEVQRANDMDDDLALVLVSLSGVQEIEQRYGAESVNAAMRSIVQVLRSSVRQYDLIGIFENHVVGVSLASTNANDAFLWAEKVRSSIASNIVQSPGKNFSVSVTIGISGAGKNARSEELIKNAVYILEQAKKAGGNIVRVF